jgi:hypothetical protein
MSLEMAHKVILPPKKNYIPQFLKQRDINSYFSCLAEIGKTFHLLLQILLENIDFTVLSKGKLLVTCTGILPFLPLMILWECPYKNCTKKIWIYRGGEKGVEVVYPGEAKVRNLERARVGHKNVLWFDVPVDDPMAVEEVHPAQDLPHKVLDLVRGQSGGRASLQVRVQILLGQRRNI